MVDVYSKSTRSYVMSRIASKDTKPEKIVRSILHRNGYRFRLFSNNLPGHPDIVMPKHRTVIFVNGCFWHQHKRCKLSKNPKSNRSYWEPKLKRNVERDKKQKAQLKKEGWTVIVIWECVAYSEKRLLQQLSKHLKLTVSVN